jgi:toxin ParE1/3/4
MKHLVLTSLSNYDLRDAVDFYNSKRPGLGERFYLNFEAKIESIQGNPMQYAIRHENVRCAKINRFPFMIHFTDLTDRIVVVGIIHTSRNPQLWKKRK